MRVARALGRQHLAMVTDATLDDLERDEPLNIGAELGEVFSRRAGAVLLQRAIDDALWQGWIECPGRAVCHEAERITGRTVVALECTRVDWRRGPPVVAKPGSTAFKISTSGLA